MTRFIGSTAAGRVVCIVSLLTGPVVSGCEAPAAETSTPYEESVMTPLEQGAIRSGYMERLRLGLGSPFRLIDFALSDPRLGVDERRSLGKDLLASTLTGETYQVDPAALLPNFERASTESLALATKHLRLIEGAIESTPDPRAGELAIRLAYQLAHLEASASAVTLSAAVSAAALMRDRELSIRDARRLADAADAAGMEPVDLVQDWRKKGKFSVERPVLQALSPRMEQEAIARAPGLLRSIRWIWAGGTIYRVGRLEAADRPMLSVFRPLADAAAMPPRASVVVALRGVGAVLPVSLSEEDRDEWTQFERDAMNEEQLASRVADLASRRPALRAATARGVLNAAVALRAHAQERVWFPGDGAPSVQQLWERHGVRVRADHDVPIRWVPYTLLVLDDALADLRMVIPDLRINGLQIVITRESSIPTALASHSPGDRVIELPAATGFGTLAHEIAHDLDWQAARRTRPKARAYASDRAAVSGAPTLKTAVAALTATSRDVGRAAQSGGLFLTRPAEVVARTFDWFIVSRLAAKGRSNGALSTGQDEVLTGHGLIRPPGSSESYGLAVIDVVRSLVSPPVEEVNAFLSQYGPVRLPRANLVLSTFVTQLEAADTGAPNQTTAERTTHLFKEIFSVTSSLLADLNPQDCASQLPLVDAQLRAAFQRLVFEAAAARMRGAALEWAQEVGGLGARAWMANRLYGPLWPAGTVDPLLESALSETADAVVASHLPAILVEPGLDPAIGELPCGWPGAGARSTGVVALSPLLPVIGSE